MIDLITASSLLVLSSALVAVATVITLYLFSYTEKSQIIKKKINKANMRITLTNVILFGLFTVIAIYYGGNTMMKHVQSLVPDRDIPIISGGDNPIPF